MATMSLSQTTKPKSDQLNAEDFLSSDKTLTITGFCFTGAADQPFSIFTNYDQKKPYKPNKSMRKIIENAWGEVVGDIGAVYDLWNGRQLTLFRDPDVEWAGKKEGGIVISAMSNIDRDFKVKLQVRRGQKKEYLIKAIKPGVQQSQQQAQQQPTQQEQPNEKREWAIKLKAAVGYGSGAVDEVWAQVPESLKPDMDSYYKEQYMKAQANDQVSQDEQQPEPEQLPPADLDNF